MNELYRAARDGSTERTIAVLARGAVDIDQAGNHRGVTPLMSASLDGHVRIVRILLNRGAIVAMVDDVTV